MQTTNSFALRTTFTNGSLQTFADATRDSVSLCSSRASFVLGGDLMSFCLYSVNGGPHCMFTVCLQMVRALVMRVLVLHLKICIIEGRLSSRFCSDECTVHVGGRGGERTQERSFIQKSYRFICTSWRFS